MTSARGQMMIWIVLTFAGLFSAVNSTFIVGMQPNPGDTTKVLLLHLIQITVNGPNTVNDISSSSSYMGYPSSTVSRQAGVRKRLDTNTRLCQPRI
ncbi:hypothetical protein F4604DRAFT_487061 [Suillus subluteus]|nr:hypothetical protein F4604DRAFT_487061 [Suillus subluteus]